MPSTVKLTGKLSPMYPIIAYPIARQFRGKRMFDILIAIFCSTIPMRGYYSNYGIISCEDNITRDYSVIRIIAMRYYQTMSNSCILLIILSCNYQTISTIRHSLIIISCK